MGSVYGFLGNCFVVTEICQDTVVGSVVDVWYVLTDKARGGGWIKLGGES